MGMGGNVFDSRVSRKTVARLRGRKMRTLLLGSKKTSLFPTTITTRLFLVISKSKGDILLRQHVSIQEVAASIMLFWMLLFFFVKLIRQHLLGVH